MNPLTRRQAALLKRIRAEIPGIVSRINDVNSRMANFRCPHETDEPLSAHQPDICPFCKAYVHIVNATVAIFEFREDVDAYLERAEMKR